jgi:hypothetical protein
MRMRGLLASGQRRAGHRAAQTVFDGAQGVVSAAALWPGVGSSASAQRGMAGGHSTGNTFRAGLDASWERMHRPARSAL